MFDVGFSELALIFGVSLVVLGPKRLPGLVSKVGRWVGKARSMARDFQQQLENEVNLEELNRITERVTREAQGITPVPPEFAGEPPATPETPTYPYPAHDSSTAETSPTEDASPEASQTDDTYSHAHAAGDAPMADVQEFAAAEPSTHDTVPVQTDLDLSQPDDDPHLPPDDAQRRS
jgi:sec-independent protein translocase protein TatB